MEAVAGEFVTSIRDDSYAAKGWSKSMYGISKLSEIAYTFCLARELRDKVGPLLWRPLHTRKARAVPPE